MTERPTPEKENDLKHLRGGSHKHDLQVMEKFKQIVNESTFDLDPICIYVIMDKLRGIHNSAGIPEKSYKKAEQMLRVLGVNKHWEGA